MKPNTITKQCLHCGKDFQAHPYRIKKGTAKYCNQSCYLAYRWGENQPCKTCGKISKHRYCSDKCRRNYWDKNGYTIYNRKSRYWKRKMAIINDLGGKCVKCGFDDYRALDIDHIDPSKKVRPKDGQYVWSRRFKDWAANKGNLQLLCANCHRLHTWEQRGFGIND